jgi:hypothetical protein
MSALLRFLNEVAEQAKREFAKAGICLAEIDKIEPYRSYGKSIQASKHRMSLL